MPSQMRHAEPPIESAAETLAGSWRVALLRASQYAFGFVSLLVTARALGPEGRALYALPLTLAALVAIAVSLSLEQAAGRMLARNAAGVAQLSRLLATAAAVLGTVGVGAVVAVGLGTRDELLAGADARSVILAALSVPLTLAIQFSLGLLFRLGALRVHGVIVAVSGGAQLLAMSVLALSGALTPFRALLVIVVGLCATALPLIVVLRRYAGPGGLVARTSRSLLTTALVAAWPLHVATFAVLLNLRLDLLLVSMLAGRFEAGVYSLSTTLAESVLVVPYIVAVAAMPTQTRASPAVGASYTVDFARQSFAIGVLVAALASAGAYPMIWLLYGAEWAGSVAPLMILAWGAVAFAVEAPMRVYLVHAAAPTSILAAAVAGMVINIGLVVLLTPMIGIVGAALGSLASYWVYTLLMLVLFRRTTELSPWSVFARPHDDDVLPMLWRRLAARA